MQAFPSTEPSTPPAPARVAQARIAFQIGERATFGADVRITPSGLLAVGALVSGILLSTAVLLRAVPPVARARLPGTGTSA